MFKKIATLNILLATILVTACAGNDIKKQEINTEEQKSVSKMKVTDNAEVVLSDFPIEGSTQESNITQHAKKIIDSNQPKIKLVNFNFDKFEITDTSKSIIKQHAEFLVANPSYILSVNGHSDYRGPEIYNEKLSLRRANSVAALLISYGTPESQLVINSYGASQPVEELDNWFQNRRVEFEYSELYMVSK